DDTLANDLSGLDAFIITDGGAGDLDGVANGTIVTSWNVNQDAADQAFLLTATDGSGGIASTTFTDAVSHVTASNFAIVDNGNGTITATVHLDVDDGFTVDTTSTGPSDKATEVHIFNSCTGTTQPGGGGSYFLTQISGLPGG